MSATWLILILAAPGELRLAVSDALPVIGGPCTLTAYINDEEDASVVFEVRLADEVHPIGLPQNATDQVTRTWTPQHTGEHVLSVRVGDARASQTVTVVKRTLHFHYWHLDPSLKYVTEGLLNDATKIAYWCDRGVMGQKWRGGKWAYQSLELTTPAALAENWIEPLERGWAGVLIDEMIAGGEIDEVLGDALIEARKRSPKIYLAVYTVAGGGEKKMRGLREAADRVLPEAYEEDDSRGYSRIVNRVDAVAAKVGMERTLVTLAFKKWITTPRELRRQLHFVRYRYPHMPGVAFFGSPPFSTDVFNTLLRQFYIDPVIRVEKLGSGDVAFKNIGGADAPATEVTLHPQVISLPPLAVDQTYTLSAAGKPWTPLSEYRDGCFILGPPLQWSSEEKKP